MNPVRLPSKSCNFGLGEIYLSLNTCYGGRDCIEKLQRFISEYDNNVPIWLEDLKIPFLWNDIISPLELTKARATMLLCMCENHSEVETITYTIRGMRMHQAGKRKLSFDYNKFIERRMCLLG